MGKETLFEFVSGFLYVVFGISSLLILLTATRNLIQSVRHSSHLVCEFQYDLYTAL